MISAVFCFGMKRIDVTVEEGGVFVVHLSFSFRNVKLALLITGVKDTEVLSVCGNKNYKMASHSKEACFSLGMTYVTDYSAAASEMLNSFVKALGI